jgi:hypothetical protein
MTRAKIIANHALHCYLCHWYVKVSKSSSKIQLRTPIIYNYVSRDKRTCGYFSNPQGVREQKGLGSNALNENKLSHRT